MIFFTSAWKIKGVIRMRPDRIAEIEDTEEARVFLKIIERVSRESISFDASLISPFLENARCKHLGADPEQGFLEGFEIEFVELGEREKHDRVRSTLTLNRVFIEDQERVRADLVSGDRYAFNVTVDSVELRPTVDFGQRLLLMGHFEGAPAAIIEISVKNNGTGKVSMDAETGSISYYFP